MRAETVRAIEDNRCIQELDSLICDIKKFNGTCPKKQTEEGFISATPTIPKQVASQIDQVSWLRSTAMTLLGVLHINQ